MQAGYFKTAWNDIKSSPGWLGKLFLLALLLFIPIFGQIVLLGYLYGWAKDAAWGIKSPLPKRIFGNEDGNLYTRGFFILVLALALSLVPAVFSFMQGFFIGIGSAGLYGGRGGGFGVFAMISMVFTVLSWVAMFAVMFFQWVGSMRISIYGRLSAGFQIGKIWAMIRKDTGGLLRIFGMMLLIALVMWVIIFVLIMIIVFIVAFAAVGASGGAIYTTPSTIDGPAIAAILAAGGIAILFFIIAGYFIAVLGVWSQMMVARALGHWTRQFDVPAWRGQEDPMPFELQASVQAPSYPANPVSGYAQQPVQQHPAAQPVPQQPAAPQSAVDSQPMTPPPPAAGQAPVQAPAPVAEQKASDEPSVGTKPDASSQGDSTSEDGKQ